MAHSRGMELLELSYEKTEGNVKNLPECVADNNKDTCSYPVANKRCKFEDVFSFDQSKTEKGIYCIEPDDTKAFPAFPVPGENEYLYSEDVDFNKINDDPYKPVQEETVEEKVSDLTLENLASQVGNILGRSIKIENKFMKDYKPDDTPVSKIENTFIMKENEETEENINSGKTGDTIASKVVKNVLAVDKVI